MDADESDSAPKPRAARLNKGDAKQGPKTEVRGKDSDQKHTGIHVGFEGHHQERGQCEQQARLAHEAGDDRAKLNAHGELVGLTYPTEQEPKDSKPLCQTQVVVKVGGVFGLKVAEPQGDSAPKEDGEQRSIGDAQAKFALAGILGTVFHSDGGR